MPDWLCELLEKEEKQELENTPSGISEILGKLLEQDLNVEVAYLCHSAVRYIGKIKIKGKDEGNNFCAYHNIQMLLSYINGVEAQSLNKIASSVPTIMELQDMIEKAWDQGFNESGRMQTGGIRGTRKHIGTPEAQALFRSLKMPCKVDRFQDVKGGAKAYEQLLDSVEHYFSTSVTTSQTSLCSKVRNTGLPPIYLQRPRHSMTIVGIEKRKDGSRNLVVFDPAYNPSKEVLRLLNHAPDGSGVASSTSMIRPCRRGKKSLKKHHAFETLRLVAPLKPSNFDQGSGQSN